MNGTKDFISVFNCAGYHPGRWDPDGGRARIWLHQHPHDPDGTAGRAAGMSGKRSGAV